MAPVTGCRCTSLIRTCSRPAPSANCSSMRLWAPPACSSRSSSRPFTATGTGVRPAPYTIPGTWPLRRSRFASPFPACRTVPVNTPVPIGIPPSVHSSYVFPTDIDVTRRGLGQPAAMLGTGSFSAWAGETARRLARPNCERGVLLASLHLKELAHGNLLKDAPDSLGKQRSDGQHADLGHPLVHRQRDRVGHHDLLD